MSTAAIEQCVIAMRDLQRAIGTACEKQPNGWRQEVVQRRRELSEQVRKASAALISTQGQPSAPLIAVRADLGRLRAALAEHQATWPAVSIDTKASAYRSSVQQVRSCFDALETAVAAFKCAELRIGDNAS